MTSTYSISLSIIFFLLSIPLVAQNQFARTYTDTLPESFKLNTSELREDTYNDVPDTLREQLDPRATFKFADVTSIQAASRFASGEVYSDWPALENYLNEVLQRVMPEALKDAKYIHAYVVKDGTFNAYMTPSGMMFIHTGLMAEVEDEATLAAILAHELGHYYEQHSLRQYVQHETGALDYGYRKNSRAARVNFSVNNELASDGLALDWIQDSGYSLNGVKKFGEMALRMNTNLLLRLKKIWEIKESSHPEPKKRIELYSRFMQEQAVEDKGASFLVDEAAFYSFAQQARIESLKHLLNNFRYRACIEKSFRYHLFDPENGSYIYYLMEGIRRQCYLNADLWNKNFITHNYYTATERGGEKIKVAMTDNLLTKLRPDILSLSQKQIKQIKARFYWDGTERFSTNEEAFIFFTKVGEVLKSNECILSNALSYSFDPDKMNGLLKSYLELDDIKHREYATSLLNGNIYTDLNSHALSVLSMFDIIVKQGDDQILVRDESKGQTDHLESILSPLKPLYPDRTLITLNSLQNFRLNDYLTLAQLQDFSFTTLFAKGDRTHLHILEPGYWELMKKLGVNEIEFMLCQYFDSRKSNRSLEGYQEVIGYSNEQLFNEVKRHRYVDTGISSVRCVQDGVMKMKISVGERKLDYNKPGFDQIISLIKSNLILADKETEVADKKYKRSSEWKK